MKSKLTLSVSSQAIRKGKRIASQRNQSLSEMLSAYIESLDILLVASNQGIDPRIDACFGAYKLPPGKSIDDVRLRALLKKHGAKV